MIEVDDVPRSPYLTIRLRCGGCGAVLAAHLFDASSDAPAVGAEHAELHVRRWREHRCPSA